MSTIIRGTRGRRLHVPRALRPGVPGILILPLMAFCRPAAAQFPPTEPPASRPRPGGSFAPGVDIDWTQRIVRVAGRIVLREGPLEFVACFAGKEHESLVRLEASAVHVYQALGLIGLSPGSPAGWDPQRNAPTPPTGDLIDARFEWLDGGSAKTAPVFAWIREIEHARPAVDRPWVFAGSVRLPDNALAADRSGSGLALVDFPDSLLALTRSRLSRDVDLWAEADTPSIPPTETPVRLVLSAAAPRALIVRLDFRGALFVDERYASIDDVADLIGLARRLTPGSVQRIDARAALSADVMRLGRRLESLGLTPAAVRIERSGR